MTTTAQQLIEAAYVRSTANDAGKLASDAELLGRLNRFYQALYALAARQRPDSFQSSTTLTLLGVMPNPGSAALPPDLIDLRRIFTAAGSKVHLIPASETDRSWHLAPAVYREGMTLWSRNKSGDPVPGDTLTVKLLDAPASLAALATGIDARFPTRHHELLVDDLAMYLASKDIDRNPAQFEQLSQEFKKHLGAFGEEYDLDASTLEEAHGATQRVSPQ